MPQVGRLQRRYDYVEWREQVNSFWRRALKDNPVTLGSNIELVKEVKEDEESEKSDGNNCSDFEEISHKSEDEEMGNDEVICSNNQNLLSTPDKAKQMGSEQSQSRSKPGKKSRLPLVREQRSIEVQGKKFNLLKNAKDYEFAEVICNRQKVEISVMKQLIEDMINKGFYKKEDETEAEPKTSKEN